MKVLMIMHDDDTYGAPKSMLKLAELLQKKYHVHPIIITPKANKVNTTCDDLQIENYVIRNWRYYVNRNRYFFEPFVNFVLNKYFDLTFYKKIAKEVDFSTVDLIHSAVSVVSHGHELSKKYHIPHIWHLRELDPYQYYFTKEQIREMSENTAKFIAISEVVKQYWSELGIDPQKITTIYNGIDSQNIIPKKRYADDGILKIVLTGRINPGKQIDIVIKAISLLEEEVRQYIHLDIYGTATKMYQGYYEALLVSIDRLSLNSVITFKGFASNVPEVLQKYDVAIMSSKAEAFGRTTVEYMFAGLAVVASNSGANQELISDKVDGLFYQNDDSRELASKIAFLYKNRAEIQSLGEQAKLTAEKKFTADKNAKNVFRLYEEVVLNND